MVLDQFETTHFQFSCNQKLQKAFKLEGTDVAAFLSNTYLHPDFVIEKNAISPSICKHTNLTLQSELSTYGGGSLSVWINGNHNASRCIVLFFNVWVFFFCSTLSSWKRETTFLSFR